MAYQRFLRSIYFVLIFLAVQVCFLGLAEHANAQKAAAHEPASSVALGSPSTLPEFTFYRFNGTPFTKKDVNQKTRSFFILFDTGCEHCQREIVSIGQHYQHFDKVTFYLVTLDQEPAVEKFMSYYGKYLKGKPNVVLLVDKKYQFIPTFKPQRYPGLFLYSTDEKLLLGKSGQTPVEEFIKLL